MSTDPAPHLLGPDDAMDKLAEWGEAYALLMAQRDPLVLAALDGPLSGHGGIARAERASALTPQTLRRIKSREDIPLLAADRTDAVDWDEYADYLEALGTDLREQLAALPAPAGGRPFTTDDFRAELLLHLAGQVRDAERTDHGFWLLTLTLRHTAQVTPSVLQEDWNESADSAAHRAVRAELLTEVADQITAYRVKGPAAADRLDVTALARVRAVINHRSEEIRNAALSGREKS
ncbi:hypothetical protein [Streptomyces sp. NPDC053720]|uniref:hypothetical protein n=1 Tax=Streptomyces sp. NPDC053720 TaxID=3154855 RepID=UPI003446CB86